MSERCLLDEDVPLNADAIRLWAYDEDIYLIQQDEDAVLWEWDFVPILLELATDPECPKADYAFSITDDFARCMIVHQEHRDLVEARKAIEWAEQKTAPAILKWAELQSSRLEAVLNPVASTDSEFLALGELLLATPTMTKTLERVSPSAAIIHSRYGSYREALLIDVGNKRVRFSRYFPDGKNPEWYEPGKRA